ncbi:lysozyme C-like [Mya arenaria]|uniref:lysozyme C-like n=1 Tax=Mya arenaria TaxID=6604 RepID=UPI0022E1CCE8|nr:lysozyme C-like [Mya arenaria]
MMHTVAFLLLCLPVMGVCMAQYESGFNTRAVNRNSATSASYGIFQINSWNCDPQDGTPTNNGCGHPCSDYVDPDLSDDVECINHLRREYNGWGFSDGYTNHCQHVTSSYLSDCGSIIFG